MTLSTQTRRCHAWLLPCLRSSTTPKGQQHGHHLRRRLPGFVRVAALAIGVLDIITRHLVVVQYDNGSCRVGRVFEVTDADMPSEWESRLFDEMGSSANRGAAISWMLQSAGYAPLQDQEF